MLGFKNAFKYLLINTILFSEGFLCQSVFAKKLSKDKQNKQPGIEAIKFPLPEYEIINDRTSPKLANKIAIFTGVIME